jgi:hypothetical protein
LIPANSNIRCAIYAILLWPSPRNFSDSAKKGSSYFENALKFADKATIMAGRIVVYRFIKRNGGAFAGKAGEKEGAVRGIKAQAAAPAWRPALPASDTVRRVGKGKEYYEAK